LVEQNLAPAFVLGGIKTRIYAGDTGWRDPIAETVLLDLGSKVISGAAFHCYGGQGGFSAFHESFPNVLNLMTECAFEDTDLSPAGIAIDALRNWSSSVDLWNTALDQNGGPEQEPHSGCPSGCTGLVTVYDGADAGESPKFTAQYYELGQLSKFVQRGAFRVYTPRWVSDINTTKPGAHQAAVTRGVDNVAVVDPDGKRVLVAYNNSNKSYRFAVRWHSLRFAYTLGGGATVTFVWQGARPAQPSSCLNAGVTWLDATDPYTMSDC
jgi:glucosylceramidase